MKYCFLIMLCLLYGCSSDKKDRPVPQLTIIEVHPSKWTALVKQNVLHMTQIYDLSSFLYTKTIQIQSQVIPHSHPILTINTTNAEKPHKILAQLLHEQFHWWVNLHKAKTDLAILELKKVYTTVPASQKNQIHSTYLHLLVCYLEYRALGFYLGKKTASSIITETMQKDKIHTWVYGQVLNNSRALEKILVKQNLFPPILKTNKETIAI